MLVLNAGKREEEGLDAASCWLVGFRGRTGRTVRLFRLDRIRLGDLPGLSRMVRLLSRLIVFSSSKPIGHSRPSQVEMQAE
jgi:hypothetical protein